MSTDPAEAAAKRAWPYLGALCGDPNGLALNAAREALAPIRALYEKTRAELAAWEPDNYDDHGAGIKDGQTDLLDDLAPLLYGPEETK